MRIEIIKNLTIVVKIMKKIYSAPEINVEILDMEYDILAGSPGLSDTPASSEAEILSREVETFFDDEE